MATQRDMFLSQLAATPGVDPAANAFSQLAQDDFGLAQQQMAAAMPAAPQPAFGATGMSSNPLDIAPESVGVSIPSPQSGPAPAQIASAQQSGGGADAMAAANMAQALPGLGAGVGRLIDRIVSDERTKTDIGSAQDAVTRFLDALGG